MVFTESEESKGEKKKEETWIHFCTWTITLSRILRASKSCRRRCDYIFIAFHRTFFAVMHKREMGSMPGMYVPHVHRLSPMRRTVSDLNRKYETSEENFKILSIKTDRFPIFFSIMHRCKKNENKEKQSACNESIRQQFEKRKGP